MEFPDGHDRVEDRARARGGLHRGVPKPSEFTSPVEHLLVAIMTAAGVPDGVVNLVNGGGDVGALLVAHPLIDKISFTGSTAVGRKVMQAAALDMKRVTLELGGKSALIVRADADIAHAVALAVGGAFTNAGHTCSATSRIIVHDDVSPRSSWPSSKRLCVRS